MKIQYIAAFPWNLYEKRRALNICSKKKTAFSAAVQLDSRF